MTRVSNVQQDKMSEEEEGEMESYKHLAQFHNILQRNELMEDRCIDKDRVLWELQTIVEQPGNISYQFPNSDIVRSCNPRLVGCTALHLVATEQCFWLGDVGQRYQETIKVLLLRGIDITLKNHRGSTALHSVVDVYYREYGCHWRLRGKLENSTVNLLLSAHVERDVIGNPRDKSGLSHFHIACMANHSGAVEFFLSKAGVSVDEVVDGDSLEFRAYTPLHLAVRCCAFEVAEILLKLGADVNVKNPRGMTPMDLLLEENVTLVDLINTVDNENSAHYYRLPRLMVCLESNKKIMELLVLHADSFKFDDTGLSRFHVTCTLENTSLVEKLLAEIDDINHCVKMNSPFWPGYTALHFAAHFDIKTVKFLLDHGANVEAKDANGLTPFDICVERYKVEDLHYILQSNAVWRDILMADNKTKLIDIILAMRDSETLDEFLKVSGKVSLRVPNDSPLWPGYTPLHLAINFSETIKIITDYERQTWYYGKEDFEKLQSEYFKRIEVCLKHGADVGVQDARGQTALHLAYRLQRTKVVTLFLQDDSRIVNSVDDDNLSHLYIVCAFDYPRIVKKLLAKNETDVNLQIKSTFRWQQNYFARGNHGEHRFFITVGSNPLHVAGTTELIRMLLEHGADVNAEDATGVTLMYRALACKHDDWRYMDSRTSMDVLALGPRNPGGRDDVVGLLLKNGADAAPTKSEENKTSRPTAAGCSTARNEDTEILHFHKACRNCDLDAMEKFLQRGVDVNRPGDLLSSEFPGYRPIHLVLHWYSQVDCDLRIKAIDLLTKYGVDVDAGDLFDNAAFHAATLIYRGTDRIRIFKKIFSIGANIRLKNVFREEPLVMLLTSRRFEIEDIDFFFEHGCHVNVYDPMREEGCMAIFFSKGYSTFKKIIRSPSITKIDDFGRNAIHNLVCPQYTSRVDYTIAIRRMMERGCDIDQRDQLGRTPLQLALKCNNYKAVTRLLEAGADINIIDAKGHSAFADVEWESTFQAMAMHIRRLQITGLYVSELNLKILDELLEKWSLDEAKIERAKADLKKMKDVKIESTSLSPYDFFSETGAIAAFPYMSLSEQQAINNYFKYMRTYHFKQLGYLMKLRHKKALKRVALVEPARLGLNLLLKCTLTEKCSRRVLQFLTNADLENIIATVN